MDMGFLGPRFTWTNFRNLSDLIQERLDRGFCNASWSLLYLEATIEHLTRINSNHCPIMIKLEKPLGIGLSRPFKFQPGWLSHPNFNMIVRDAWRGGQSLDNAVQFFTNSTKQWNREVFENLFSYRKKIEARLNGVQKALANRPNDFLVELERSLRKDYVDVKELIDEF